jgi:hypothetical protein
MATITERVNKAGETDVKRWIQSIESAIDEHRQFPSKESLNHTLAEVITRYQAEILVQLSQSEITNRTRQLGYWSDQLGGLTLADVTPDLIAEHRTRLANGITHMGRLRTPATVNRYLAALSAVLGHKTLAMVKRYAHLSEQHTVDVLQRMNEVIFND